jgi:hypothetical protein
MLTVHQTLPPSLVFFKREKTSMANRLITNWGRLSIYRMGGIEWNIYAIVICSQHLGDVIHGKLHGMEVSDLIIGLHTN